MAISGYESELSGRASSGSIWWRADRGIGWGGASETSGCTRRSPPALYRTSKSTGFPRFLFIFLIQARDAAAAGHSQAFSQAKKDKRPCRWGMPSQKANPPPKPLFHPFDAPWHPLSPYPTCLTPSLDTTAPPALSPHPSLCLHRPPPNIIPPEILPHCLTRASPAPSIRLPSLIPLHLPAPNPLRNILCLFPPKVPKFLTRPQSTTLQASMAFKAISTRNR